MCAQFPHLKEAMVRRSRNLTGRRKGSKRGLNLSWDRAFVPAEQVCLVAVLVRAKVMMLTRERTIWEEARLRITL